MGKKTDEQEKVIDNHNKFYNSREEVINFLETILKCYPMLITMQKNETKETRLKISTPKQTLQRLPIPHAQVKTGNNSESFLNEIR